MAVRMSEVWRSGLRYEPSERWIRAYKDDRLVIDTRRPVVVWFEGKTVPQYAFHEEDEVMLGHARDPFARIDVRQSSRHVRIEKNGELLAETTRPVLLFETGLPTRYYLPREDVVAPIVTRSARTRGSPPTTRSAATRTSPGTTPSRCRASSRSPG